MPTYEHASSIGTWFFKALVESAKLRQMTFNEEAAHHNKANCRYQQESRTTGGVQDNYNAFDQAHALILQGVHAVADEATAAPAVINAYVPYPQGAGLGPFLRRPIPVVHGFRGVLSAFPGTPTLANLSYHDVDLIGDVQEVHGSASFYAMPETAVGVTGIDAGTDFRTSLVIAHRWSNNENGSGIGAVHHGGYLFWRVLGHVAAY